jgi:glycine dehydrogenase subunit 1
MSLLGERGLRDLAALNHARAVQAADRMSRIPGVSLVNDSFFNEFTLKLPVNARDVVHIMAADKVLGGVSLGRLYPGTSGLEKGLVIAVTEVVSEEDIETLATALQRALAEGVQA